MSCLWKKHTQGSTSVHMRPKVDWKWLKPSCSDKKNTHCKLFGTAKAQQQMRREKQTTQPENPVMKNPKNICWPFQYEILIFLISVWYPPKVRLKLGWRKHCKILQNRISWRLYVCWSGVPSSLRHASHEAGKNQSRWQWPVQLVPWLVRWQWRNPWPSMLKSRNRRQTLEHHVSGCSFYRCFSLWQCQGTWRGSNYHNRFLLQPTRDSTVWPHYKKISVAARPLGTCHSRPEACWEPTWKQRSTFRPKSRRNVDLFPCLDGYHIL